MTSVGWLQIALVLVAVLVAAWPLGAYMARVFSGERTLLSPLLAPLERGLYCRRGRERASEQTLARLYARPCSPSTRRAFSCSTLLMRLQGCATARSPGLRGVAPDLAFNTAVSFVTNTNWQSYGGETTMSHLVQMAGLTRAELPVRRDRHRARGRRDARFLPAAAPRRLATSGSTSRGPHSTCCCRFRSSSLSPSPRQACRRRCRPTSTRPRSKAPSRRLRSARSRARRPSSSSAPTAAASSTPMPRTRSRTRTPGRTSFRSGACCSSPTALTFTFGRMVGDRRQGYALLAVMGNRLLVAGTAIVYASETAGNPLLDGRRRRCDRPAIWKARRSASARR